MITYGGGLRYVTRPPSWTSPGSRRPPPRSGSLRRGQRDDTLRRVAASLLLRISVEDAEKANSKAPKRDLLRNTREEMGLFALSQIMEAAGVRPSKAASLCDALDDAWCTLTAYGLDQAARQFGVELPFWSALPDRILIVLNHIALNPAVADASTSATSASVCQ